MSAVVKCDCCGEHVPYQKATHIRAFKMTSATKYAPDAVMHCDVCRDCYTHIKSLMTWMGKENAD